MRARFAARARCRATRARCRAGHDGLGLGLLGIPGDEAVDAETYARIRADVLARVRGTVQADILKEDQAQNTCIFSTEFSLKRDGRRPGVVRRERGPELLLGLDLRLPHRRGGREPDHAARLHARERLHLRASTTCARGMAVDDFAPNFSFFFSNGLDAEYSVIGRVARRIWAIAMRERYGAARAQPEAQVPHPDLGPLAARAGDGVQRHPHHAPGAHRDPGPLQQPAHERLRRGGDDADRGVACGARSRSSSIIQRELGIDEEREPAPGLAT